MANPYRKAPDSVVATVEHMINLYHEDLQDARIGVLFRDEAPVTGGMVVLGEAQKVSDKWGVYAQFDFVIWFAEDWWHRLTRKQQEALADHELEHCAFAAGKASTRVHDIAEFSSIIERHGFWWPNAKRAVEVVQQAALGLEVQRVGRVTAIDEATAEAFTSRGMMRERGLDVEFGVGSGAEDPDHTPTGTEMAEVLGEDGAE